MRRTVVAAAVAGVIALAGCSSDAGTDGAVAGVRLGGDSNFVSGDGTVLIIPEQERKAAPALAGTSVDGKPLSLSDFRGRTVAINVWASWCGPCRGEAPALEAVAESYADRGVSLLGINTRDSQPAAQAFQRSFGTTFPSLSDSDGQLQLLFRDTVSPQSIPSTLLVDAQGRVAGRIIGPVTRLGLESVLDTLIGPSATPTASPAAISTASP